MSDEGKPAPKIIVDDDWKERVQSEKEQLRKQAASPEKASPEKASPAKARPERESRKPAAEASQLPPASFPMLISALATQTLMALGQIADPSPDAPPADLHLAKHHIDLLSMLQEKTKGNLTGEEVAMLENVLHELRMLYVTISRGAAGSK